MNDLRNTIAHILEHKQHLAAANEATTQQYVVLPILRALGWDDTNLASMEVIPEYKVESKRADYTLHVKRENPVVVIECKRWSQSIEKYEGQICFYAYSRGIPLAIITNGKFWRFYLSGWKASSLKDRIFCEIDIENREGAISNLEKYLLKSSVASEEAELNAQIALEEKENLHSSKPSPSDRKTDRAKDIIDEKSTKPEVTVTGKWTIDQVKDMLTEEVRRYHEANFSEDRRNIFYRKVAETQNLIETEEWRLNPPKLNKSICSFFLMNEGVTRGKRIFGVLLTVRLPHAELINRNSERITGFSIASNPPRIFVTITKEEAEQLENRYGCNFFGIDRRLVYYDIPDNLTELLPVLEFAYKKHRGIDSD